MENLFGTIGTKDPKYLLKSLGGEDAEAKITISVEPDNGVIPAGAVLYRKDSGLYAPAATGNITSSAFLVVLRDEVDTTENDAIALAAAAYRKGVFLKGYVLYKNSSVYEAVTQAHAVVLRGQNIELAPLDDWTGSAVEIDNRVALSVTVTAGSNGSASADKQTAKKGEVVTLTITPASTYVVDEIEVTAGGVTIAEDNTFVMGEEAVTIEVSFKAGT